MNSRIPSRTPLLTRLLLPSLLLLAAFLRFYHLGHSSLWSDEGNTWALLSRSFAQIARDAAADIHPPGYYWLLKLWTLLFGTTAIGMRSFSALLGVLLVYFVYRVGRLVTLSIGPKQNDQAAEQVALLAAALVALNPLQIYYSQEARMYMLLAVASTGLIWSLLYFIHVSMAERPLGAWRALLGYISVGIVGLWTHYSFPILLLAAGLGGLSLLVFSALWPPADNQHNKPGRTVLLFIIATGLMLLGYLPWLPTAIQRVLAWPAGGEDVAWWTGVQLTLQTLLHGPITGALTPRMFWLAVALLLPIFGAWAGYRKAATRRAPAALSTVTVILLWWLLPVGLMFGAGLFTDAFLKFLLTASPAWLLLVAMATQLIPYRWFGWGTACLLMSGALLLAAQTLPNYYTDPHVRDNYAGVAAYIAAVADPEQDLVLLDAPGQQEVWAYYDPGVPVLALPQTRPPDATATIDALANATANRRNVYALFWATDEADPDHIVETWLDQHAYQGIDEWQGNLRFAVYTLSPAIHCIDAQQPIHWGKSINLLAHCQPAEEAALAGGEAALLGLRWQATEPLSTTYKVTVQLLDERNQVIAQRDSVPGGGSRPTNEWEPGAVIVDNHSVVVPLGTPPGVYRMIVALYDANTGVRLPVAGEDYLALGEVRVEQPTTAIPPSIVPVQYRLNRTVGPITLVGYSAHRQGMSHAPATPLVVGDLVEFTFVWQAPEPLPADWPAALSVTLHLGDQAVTFAPSGPTYPTAAWQAGDVLQYRLYLPFDGQDRVPMLQVGEESVQLRALPVE